MPANAKRAVALQYGTDDAAPVVVASGMGYLAEKIVDVAQENGVPVYEDDSLATMLSQLKLGQPIPPELYQAIVEIYVYFLNFDPARGETISPAPRPEAPAPEEPAAPAPDGGASPDGSASPPAPAPDGGEAGRGDGGGITQ